MPREEKSASVPATDKQAEDDLWRCCGAERGVWTENMLIALERGVKGNKWFSLIDKVASERTLGIGWQKVKSNAGACGVDGITVGRFTKDSRKRLLAVKEHIKQARYQPKPIRFCESGEKEGDEAEVSITTDGPTATLRNLGCSVSHKPKPNR